MIARLTIKQLAANKQRLIATAFAVILGVAFLAGTLILTDTIRGTLDNALVKADAGIDAYVRGTSPIRPGYGQGGPPLDANLSDAIRNVDGVDQVSVEVSGYAQILDKAGKAVGSATNGGVLGLNWVTVAELNPYSIVSGRPPTGPNEIAIDRHSAKIAKLKVGDHTTVLSTGEPRPATIVGLTRFGNAASPGALSLVLFDDNTAEAVLNTPGQVDAFAVTARRGVSPDTLVERLAPVVSAPTVPAVTTGWLNVAWNTLTSEARRMACHIDLRQPCTTVQTEVISGASLTKEHQDQIGKDISQFGMFLTIFALISLFVGAFIINNTFSIIVSQRTKEMALLRAVGASGRQVRLAVLAEAAITGLVASAVGLVAGIGVAIGIRSLLSALGVDIPLDTMSITPTTVTISILVGFLITVVSAVMPARRASKVPPLAAMREVAQDRSAVSKTRFVTGTAITALAITTLLVGLHAANAKIVGLGAVALFLAVSALGPVFARPVAAVLGLPLAKLRGTAGAIARQNAMRNPTRTSRTAASLMIGVALVSFLTIFAASLKSSGAGAFRDDFHGTAVIDSGGFDGTSGLSPSLAADLRTRPGVRTISEQRNSAVEIDGQPGIMSAYDTATIGTLFDLGHVEGDVTQLGPDGIAVKAGTGPNAVKLGDTRTVTFPGGTATFVVRATYDHGAHFFGSHFVDLAAFDANQSVSLDSRIYVDATDVTVLDRAAATYPTATVLTTDAFITQQSGQLDTILTLMYALLGLAVVIALLGIANTLALSIHERRRELGLLRAVGMSRAQVRSSVRWESVIIALFGTALGLAIGALLGWAMVRATSVQGVGRLVIPTASLFTIATIAAVAGVVAALMPARRAARVDILDAIATG